MEEDDMSGGDFTTNRRGSWARWIGAAIARFATR